VLILIGILGPKFSSGGLAFDKNTIMPIIVALIFVGAGCFLLFGTVPIVFDKGANFVWKGRKSPETTLAELTLKNCVRMEDIHALQLISYIGNGPKSKKCTYYEINLVMKNGNRFNVVVHDSKNKVRQEAGVISLFLDKPIWDAT